jgi:heterotetrameric sarcosine oxidase delta subunit
MIQINCPNCGLRNSQEFRYGGEYNPRPSKTLEVGDAEWADYIYMRDNKLGVQKEWWYHRSGCGRWFFADRHTKTNHVLRTYLWQPASTLAEEPELTQPTAEP